ncbi:exported hypothetical protein [Paraburkholderia ribeironis]|uniref:Uncharacterized protein n=1 Tax=Paraburkholderia ribeironis TaxID=1247936 RepID=A0A1N7SDP1_9BURK|nr:exported hypothetical protein [Paraburkholderia ribeironis]
MASIARRPELQRVFSPIRMALLAVIATCTLRGATFARDCGIFWDARFHLHRRAVHSDAAHVVAASVRTACGA